MSRGPPGYPIMTGVPGAELVYGGREAASERSPGADPCHEQPTPPYILLPPTVRGLTRRALRDTARRLRHRRLPVVTRAWASLPFHSAPPGWALRWALRCPVVSVP